MSDLLKSCDSLEAIQESTKSIKSFNELLEKRNQARKEYGERILKTWVVCGHISLDNFAQTMLFSASRKEYYGKPEYFSNIPSVFLMKDTNKYGIVSYSQSHGGDYGSPEWYSKCPITKRGWVVENYFKNIRENADFMFNLKEYVGKPISDVDDYFYSKSVQEGITYKVWKQLGIRNDKYIDNTPVEDYPTLKKNENGWWKPKYNKSHRDGKDEMDTIGDYIIQTGDEVSIKKITLFHINGFILKQTNDTLLEFEECFIKAGFKNYQFEYTKNEYWGDSVYAGSWYNVTTEFGIVCIGWRKSVVSIFIYNSKVDCNQIKKELNHNVTSEKNLIHACNIKNVTLYLQKIYEQLNK